MEELKEINVEEIMERIRENIRRRRGGGETLPGSPAASAPANGRTAADLAILHTSYDVYQIPFTSHRRVWGPVIVFVKETLRRLLTPILMRQVAYNGANTRVVTYLKEQLDAMRGQIESLGQQQARIFDVLGEKEKGWAVQAQELKAGLAELKGEVHEFKARAHEPRTVTNRELQAVRERLARVEGKFRQVRYALTEGQEGDNKVSGRSQSLSPLQLESEFDSLAFGERFWGSEEEVKGRRQTYLESFRGCDGVLDIGCGRGEFLELLREAGIKAQGVDLDLDMVLLCRDKGLAVVRGDAFAHLESLPDASLGGIFAAQVIEHMQPAGVIQLVRLCHRKLRPGGVLILETPNPGCLMIFAQSFYMDFTHIRPVHPEALRFLLESSGFERVELRFSSPVDSSLRMPFLKDPAILGPDGPQFNKSLACLNELLFGYQDYAAIGRKI